MQFIVSNIHISVTLSNPFCFHLVFSTEGLCGSGCADASQRHRGTHREPEHPKLPGQHWCGVGSWACQTGGDHMQATVTDLMCMCAPSNNKSDSCGFAIVLLLIWKSSSANSPRIQYVFPAVYSVLGFSDATWRCERPGFVSYRTTWGV